MKCHQTIQLTDYLFIKKCHSCQARRPWRVWFVQIAVPLISLLIWFLPHNRLPFLVEMVLLAYLGLVAAIDLEHHLVLGPLSLAGILIGAISGTFLHGWLGTLLGGTAGFLFMYAIYWLGRGFSAWMSKRSQQPIEKEALGFGDVYIATIIGLAMGWPGVSAGLILGILMGGIFSSLFLLRAVIFKRYRVFSAIPYAPFLIISAVCLIFWPK
jgi:leader peptidase (prepilin peptidase)/N-methyltransferase